MNKQEEVDVARALLAGSPEAFERFVDYFRVKIFRYTWLMCGHREDAEEVAQETLLRVFEKFSQLENPEQLRTWVFRIARNECLMLRRKSVYAPARELSLDEFLPAATDEAGGRRRLEIADWALLPDERVLQSELHEEIERGIRELPEAYRAVVLLRDVEELKTDEVAQILEMTPDLVKTRLHRGRLALRQKLESYLRVAAASLRGEAAYGV